MSLYYAILSSCTARMGVPLVLLWSYAHPSLPVGPLPGCTRRAVGDAGPRMPGWGAGPFPGLS